MTRTGSTIVVSGTLQAGTLHPSTPLLLLPSNELVVTRALLSRGAPVTRVQAGEHCELTISTVEMISPGNVLCAPAHPVPLAWRVEAYIRTLPPSASLHASLLLAGSPVELFVHSAACAASLHKITASADPHTGERVPDGRPPRRLTPRTAAYVTIDLEQPVPLEVQASCPQLSRIVLRDGGQTVAVGHIVAILPPPRRR